jgi:ADP-dependent NAD(P)H-hydrate dehydratase / NAD(P)H-hydrate epimerase
VIPLVDAAQMRSLDAATIALGLPAFTLMETAGRGVAERVLADAAPPRRVAVVCGGGGNGGDGLVVARVLRDRGVEATVFLAAAPPADSPAGEHRRLLERCGAVVVDVSTAEALAAQRAAICGAELVIDALFGVGLARPVSGHFAEVVAVMNAAPRRWSIDVPSGLDSDRGVPLGACVSAEATVSLGLHKIGAVTSPGFAHAGELHLVDLGLPRALIEAAGLRVKLLEERDCRALVPRAHPLDHKGRRGHVLVVGGRLGMRGAGELCATAAMRAGAGLCTWAAPGQVAPTAQLASLMTRGFPDVAELARLLRGKAALCIGPGLGRDAVAEALVECVLAPPDEAPESSRLPVAEGAGGATVEASEASGAGVRARPAMVLDADALFALAKREPGRLPAGTVLTPHPGEAARLLGVGTDDVEADRLAAARALVQRFGAVVVLKGARTIISDEREDWICAAGTPALATAGSGDVLAGAITSLCAQGLSAMDAALLGTWIHGRAGRRLEAHLGSRGVLSSDLPSQLSLELAALARAMTLP